MNSTRVTGPKRIVHTDMNKTEIFAETIENQFSLNTDPDDDEDEDCKQNIQTI